MADPANPNPAEQSPDESGAEELDFLQTEDGSAITDDFGNRLEL